MKMELGVGVNEATQRYWGMPLTEQHFASTNREWVECGYDVIRQVSEEPAFVFNTELDSKRTLDQISEASRSYEK